MGQPEEVDDAALIADMLVITGEPEAFWDSEAKSLITLLLLHVANDRLLEERTLRFVWELLMQGEADFTAMIEDLRRSEHPAITRIAGGFSQKEVRERSAVISTAQTHMKIWRSPLLSAATSRSDFRLEDLKRATTSIYVVLPPEYLEVYQPFVRLIIGLAVVAMTRVDARSANRVVFFLDEVAALGYMRPVETGIAYLAGYGVSLWLFFQDLDQIEKTYRRWRSIIANCHVRQAFNVADVATARELSETMGTRTVATSSSGETVHSPAKLLPTTFSSNAGETARPLMTADEVLRLSSDRKLLFVQGCHPILARKIRWFADQPFKGRVMRAARRQRTLQNI